jgi:membrane protein
MVQDALYGWVDNFLKTIPSDHREFVQDYILKFKDSYLSSIHEKSGSMGIFAVFILIWIGLQAFNNVDRTLNEIWCSDRQRPFLEQVRNFLVISVAAPLVLISGLSIPLILTRTPAGKYLFHTLPFLAVMVNSIITPALILVTFYALYRYVPVRKVRWKSALVGAVFSTLLLEVANSGMDIYFRMGTETAYGKIAIVPLFAFWIYVVWLIVMSGAEVSYIAQNERDLLVPIAGDPPLREGEALLLVLVELQAAHRQGKNPVDFERLRSLTTLDSDRLHHLLAHLTRRGFVLQIADENPSADGKFVLARDLQEVKVPDLLRDLFQDSWAIPRSPIAKEWAESLTKWVDSFRAVSLTELANTHFAQAPRRIERNRERGT